MRWGRGIAKQNRTVYAVVVEAKRCTMRRSVLLPESYHGIGNPAIVRAPPIGAYTMHGDLPSAAGGLSSIEQRHADTLVCDAPGRPLLRAVSPSRRKVLYYKPRCKSWHCAACAVINARMWTVRIYQATEALIADGEAISFTTLTTHEKLTPEASWRLFYPAWKRLLQRVRRAAGAGEYVMIPEAHQSGRMHVHMLDTWNLKTRWWKDNARGCGMGYMAESEFAETPGGAAHYAAKYLTKAIVNEQLRRVRKIRKSQGFLKESAPPAGDDWQIEKLDADMPLMVDAHGYEQRGYDVLHVAHGDVFAEMEKLPD